MFLLYIDLLSHLPSPLFYSSSPAITSSFFFFFVFAVSLSLLRF
jgi:hypothetical protein